MGMKKSLITTAVSLLAMTGLATGCTTMPSGPNSTLCEPPANTALSRLPSANLDEQSTLQADREDVLCTANTSNMGFIAQNPNSVTLDDHEKLDGSPGSWKLNFGTLDRNIASQFDIHLKDPGVYKLRAAIKSDQDTNLVLLCGFPGLNEGGGFQGKQTLVKATDQWKKVECLFEIPDGKELSALQIGFSAVPSETPRNSVTVNFDSFQVVRTNLTHQDLVNLNGGGEPEYPGQSTAPTTPPANQGIRATQKRRPYLGI